MADTIVTVDIPQAAALRRGSTEWGAQQIDLGAVLDLLTDEQRARIRVDSHSALRLTGDRGAGDKIEADSTTPSELAAAIVAQIAAAEARHAELVAGATRRAKKYLASDSADTWGWVTKGEQRLLDDNLRQQVDAEGQRRRAVREKQEAEARAQREREMAQSERERAAKRAAEDASRKVWRSWAEDHGSDDLRAAIRDGYPLGERVEREMVAHLLPVAPAGTERRPLGRGDSDGERRVPNAASRSARSALTAALPDDMPEGTEVTVGRIHSVYWWEDCDCGCRAGAPDEDCNSDVDCEIKIHRTAVPVTVTAAHYEHTEWYVIDEA